MSLIKQNVVDQITINELGVVFYREATRITEDGTVIAEKYNRTSVSPGEDLTGVPDSVVAICNTVWTPEVVQKYNDHIAERVAAMTPAAE